MGIELYQNPISDMMFQMEYFTFSIQETYHTFFVGEVKQIFFWDIKSVIQLITRSSQLKEVTISLEQYLKYDLLTMEDLNLLVAAIVNNQFLQKINLGDKSQFSRSGNLQPVLMFLVQQVQNTEQRNNRNSLIGLYGVSHLRSECYQKIEPEKEKSKIIQPRFDAELGVFFIDDLEAINFPIQAKGRLTETNLKFLKILVQCQWIMIQKGTMDWSKSALSKQDITNVVNTIYNQYGPFQGFADSDLHDDIFDAFDVITPNTAANSTTRQHFFQRHQDKFVSQNDCDKFLQDRAKLFCLYILLRRCAILYRDLKHEAFCQEPFNLLRNFLEKEDNLESFKEKHLRVQSFRFHGENWGSGLHEWLTCNMVIQALLRTAALVKGVLPLIPPVQGCNRLIMVNEYLFFQNLIG